MSEGADIEHAGGCHCGAVRFAFRGPARLRADRCTCSICAMTGHLHIIVPAERFRLVKGEAALAEYRFNSGTARHLFCRHCGVKSFYVPRSHPDGFSVNARCLDGGCPDDMEIGTIDGRNWEAAVEGYRAAIAPSAPEGT